MPPGVGLDEVPHLLREGSPAAVDTALQKLRDAILESVKSLVRNNEAAEDIAQEVLLRVWAKLDRWQPAGPGSFSAWVFGVTYRVVQEERRRSRGTMPLFTEEPEDEMAVADRARHLEQQALDTILKTRIIKLLEGVHPESSQVIQLRLFEDLSFNEISSKLGITSANARKKYERGIRLLRERLKE